PFKFARDRDFNGASPLDNFPAADQSGAVRLSATQVMWCSNYRHYAGRQSLGPHVLAIQRQPWPMPPCRKLFSEAGFLFQVAGRLDRVNVVFDLTKAAHSHLLPCLATGGEIIHTNPRHG